MTTTQQKRYGIIAFVSGIFGLSIYIIMVSVTLPHIEAVSGLRPFDMRPAGYSPDEAFRLLDSLRQTGREYYLTRQLPLDLIYPTLMAMTLVSLLKWLGPGVLSARLLFWGVGFSILAAFADYVENLGIALMLTLWPDVPATLIRISSLASVTKATSTTVAILIVLTGLAVLSVRRIRKPAPA